MLPQAHDSSDRPAKLGFLPTTRVATPRGWQSVSSLLPGDLVLTPEGTTATIRDTQLTSLNDDTFYTHEDWPVLIPSYGIGNLTEIVVLPDQSFHLPATIMGLQHRASRGPVKARDLVGVNGIRTLDPSDVQVAIALTFEQETVISCAHGGLAVCGSAENTSHTNMPALLAA